MRFSEGEMLCLLGRRRPAAVIAHPYEEPQNGGATMKMSRQPRRRQFHGVASTIRTARAVPERRLKTPRQMRIRRYGDRAWGAGRYSQPPHLVPFPHSGSGRRRRGETMGSTRRQIGLHVAAKSYVSDVHLLWSLNLVLPMTRTAEFDDLLDRLVAFSGRIVGSAGRPTLQGVGAPSADPASSPVLLHRAMRYSLLRSPGGSPQRCSITTVLSSRRPPP